MNTKTLGIFLGLATLSGCVVANQPYSGNVQFTWSFSGLSCSQAQIGSVQIVIPGEQLQNNGVYSCIVANYPGIVLHDFRPGTYNFSIYGLNSSGAALYTGSGVFTVNGDVRVSIDLTPVGAPSSYAYLSWNFPSNSLSPNPNCAQAGMDYAVEFVDVQIDGQVTRYNCVDGMATPGVRTPYLNPGSHQITLSAISVVTPSGGRITLHGFAGTLTTYSGSPISASYGLQWVVGGVAVSWQLSNGAVVQTCGGAGIASVYTNFQDATGNFMYTTPAGTPSPGDQQPCTAGYYGASIRYNYFPPGTYRLYIQGDPPDHVLYRSNFTNPPRVDVVAGQFANPSQPAGPFILIRGQ
jgi:hypothetical protein